MIEDDGEGMTEEHFRKRWMMLRYNRLLHQGSNVFFPPERKGLKKESLWAKWNWSSWFALFCR